MVCCIMSSILSSTNGYMGTYTSLGSLEVWLDDDGVEDVSELDEDDEVLESNLLSDVLW